MAATKLLDALRWYETRNNSGRGRLTGESRQLLKRGLLTLTWISMHCWTLTLSERGRAAFSTAHKETA